MTTDDTSTKADDESIIDNGSGTTTDDESDTSTDTPKQRSVADILALGTYQGCTDEEIQSVIDFFVDAAHNDEETKARQAAAITSMNDTTDAYVKAANESNDILKQLLAKDLNLGKIGADGFPEGSDSQ